MAGQPSFVRQATVESDAAPPRFLVELTPWPLAFFDNLRAFVTGLIGPKHAPSATLADHQFWRTNLVQRGISRRALFDSLMIHAVLVGLTWVLSTAAWLRPTPRIVLRNPADYTTLTYYAVSDYLPAISAKLPPPPVATAPDPVLGRQQIVSLPPEPDNLRRTVIATPKVALKGAETALPNLIAPATPAPIQPIAASNLAHRALSLPAPAVAAPASDISETASRRVPVGIRAEVVAPAPEATIVHPKLTLPTLLREVIPPVPEARNIGSGTRAAGLRPEAVPPAPAVYSVSRTGSADAHALAARLATAAPIPAMPRVDDVRGARAADPVLALSTRPAEIRGPIRVPNETHVGAFAVGREGRPGATGSPGASTPEASGIQSSITIGEAPIKPPPGPVAVRPSNGPSPFQVQHSPGAMIASASLPPKRSQSQKPATIEERVFAGKRSFSLAVNMPNFNSSTGSWIIHFAELGPRRENADIAAPVVLGKVDPAYPPDLMHDRIEGTVVLYAIIHADGSVSDVRVLKTLNERLDKNAISALQRWRFAPGLKGGHPVDLEAVVQVPFRARSTTLGR